ncbi:exodeoxyribonuclease V subunit gamma [Gordonia sp. PP30]|uniref:exodeoxyribonuclease V subunit gamma n=1 Tax=Gordonia sp. PP30 TaxID=2935861 RepID=UPI001FFF7F77|nr:exodeoxyribonuclease V subunit gamma [Gordonia sp. PP30]UQE76711.1 exodeoxyribonuclease V subunit gamma [Gordonia sp. PP30]
MLTVHRGENAGVLADVLAEQLAVPLADPMATEVVSVPAYGMQRWLQQRLATRLGTGTGGDGIAANIDFTAPTALLRRVVVGISDDPEAAEHWYTDALVWPVLRVLDAHLSAPELEVLAGHLRGRGRRFAAAATIARLLGDYGWQRPAMLADWSAHRDTDGAGRPLPEPLRWQPWLWRLVREEVGQPHLAEQLDDVAGRLRSDPGAVDLPPRFALFGPVRLPESLRVVLHALAAGREVSLYLPHPSDALWQAVAARPVTVPQPRESGSRHRGAHPLLAALSRDIVELQEVLAPSIGDDVYHPESPAAAPATLLTAVRSGLREDAVGPAAGLPAADDSLEIHACHGPERQVEVLRDRLLRLFDDHRDLEPRDVLVVCPDVETFAPLIAGAFGRHEQDHPGSALRVRLADRGLAETNEVLDVLDHVLSLAAGRVRSGDLLDLIALPAVRRRFAFTDDDLDTLAGWIERSGIRWGIDGTQRDRFGLAGFPQGTAVAGRDRILLGVLAEEAENQWLGVGLPLEGIDSTKIDLAGRFAELIDRLGTLLGAADGSHPAREWAELLTGAVDRLTEPDRETQWQRAQAIGMLTDALASPGAAAVELDLTDVRDLMRGLLAARPSRTNFGTGELTVTSLAPMRSVPHRAVILLGLDAEVFPRTSVVDGDDVLARVPLVGERNRRDEDRQIFLDALTAATDHLLIFYTGSDPVTGATVPPPAVVADLIETAGRVRPGPPGIVQRHTLHAFDERNFTAHDGAAPASYDARLLPGARALSGLVASGDLGEPGPRLADAVLPPAPGGDIDLDDLIDFLASPLERFVRQRLGAVLPESAETHPDQLDVTLDGLQAWKIGDRYLRAFLRGEDPRVLGGAELRRGTLPPFALGTAALRPIEENARAIGVAAQSQQAGDPDTVDVVVRLRGGRRLYGTVGDVFGDKLVAVNYSKLAPKHRLEAWIRLLAIAAGAARPVREAVVIGAPFGSESGASLRRLTRPDEAEALLGVLVAIRDAGLRGPLWLPPRVAEAAAGSYGRAQRVPSAMARVRGLKEWMYRDRYTGLVVFDDPARLPSIDELMDLDEVPLFGDLDPVLPAIDGANRFLRLSEAVYGPLLRHEGNR